MIVREAAPGERDEIRELLATAYGQYRPAVPVTALFEHYLADLLDVDAATGSSTTLVAESDGRLAGTARLYLPGTADEVPFLPAGWAWVRAVAVHPDLRRAGVARQLMAECLHRTTGRATVLSLHTMDFMPGAIRLYERLGYRRAPELDIDVAGYYGVGGEMVALAYRLDVPS